MNDNLNLEINGLSGQGLSQCHSQWPFQIDGWLYFTWTNFPVQGAVWPSLFPFWSEIVKSLLICIGMSVWIMKRLSDRFCWYYISHKGRHKEMVLFYPLLEFHRKVSSQYPKAIHDTCAWIQCQTLMLTTSSHDCKKRQYKEEETDRNLILLVVIVVIWVVGLLVYFLALKILYDIFIFCMV